MFYINLGVFGLDLGMLLLFIGIAALLIDVFLVIFGDYIDNWELYSEWSLLAGSAAIIFSFIYFSLSVINADYGFTYVYDFINNDMDIIMRVSAIWSGQSGSYFFWTILILILYLIFRILFRSYSFEPLFYRSFIMLGIHIAFLAGLTILSDPFEINTQAFSDGIGLNPLLLNIWNFIHPPIIFIGYALCLIPMVIGIAKISLLKDGEIENFEGKEKLDSFFEFIVSLAWLTLSSGIVIGAYWAYITLGWGGFWAWDPVETASLIPWLFLTLFYHGKSFKSEFLQNYVITLPYITSLFATYLTRSNIVSSVHTFQSEGILESILKLIIPERSFVMSIILRFIPDERMLFLLIIIFGTFLLPNFMGLRNKELIQIPISLNRKDFQFSRAKTTTLKISYISLLFGTFLIILGLIAPVIYDIIGYLISFSPVGFGSSITVTQIYYNTIAALFGGIMLVSQFFCTFYPKLTTRKKVVLIIGGVGFSAIWALSGFLYRNGVFEPIFPSNPTLRFLNLFWTSSEKANFIIPLLILGIIGLAYEFVRILIQEERNFIQKSSQTMLHFSFLIILLGALTSANMTSSYELIVEEDRNYIITGSSLTVSVLNIKTNVPNKGLHVIEYDTEVVILDANAKVVGYGVSRLAFDKLNRKDSEVTIVSTMFADIYIVTLAVYENQITGDIQATGLQIKIIPYINILWAGCLFLHFAIAPLTIGRFLLMKKVISLERGKKEDIQSEEESQSAIKTS